MVGASPGAGTRRSRWVADSPAHVTSSPPEGDAIAATSDAGRMRPSDPLAMVSAPDGRVAPR